MDYDGLVDAIEGETATIATTLRGAPRDARVPSCPDFALVDLARHVGEFTGFWTHVLCEGTGREKTPFEPVPTDDRDFGDWYGGLGRHLVAELRAASADTPVWTWKDDDQHARFVARRCAHEVAIHRYDLQLAVGTPGPIDAELAADGIEEIFVIVGTWGLDSGEGNGETLHLHGTDRPDEWFLTLLPDRLDVRREHAKADLALRGAVSDLELLLYQRPTVGDVERIGDESVLDAFHREFTFG